MTPVYLDHAATTPPRPEVVAAMTDALSRGWGNPSSIHGPGRAARAILDDARAEVAASLGADAREIAFTSGGTEAINLAIKGAAWAGRATGERIVTTGADHDAVLASCRFLERFGFEARITRPTGDGRPDPEAIRDACTDRTVVVSIQLANNEVGSLADVAGIAALVRRDAPRALIHVDAVQGAAWLPIDVRSLGVDLLSIGGHKIEGPKGIGALWMRTGVTILPQVHGGGQERYRRAGTEHVAGAAGLARALALAVAERPDVPAAVRGRRDALVAGILAIPGVRLTGAGMGDRLPNHASFLVEGVSGDDLVTALDRAGVAASTGSACGSGSGDPSHVLVAMGIDPEAARGSLRLTLGRMTTDDEIAQVIALLPGLVARLRSIDVAGIGAAPGGVGIGG